MSIDIATVGDAYLALIREFPLRPIRTELELDAAIKMIDKLLDRGTANLLPEEEDYLDVLGTLVEKYEDVHHRMPADHDEA